MVLPNFFIIGSPKCGTTALSEYLRTHPNIYMCEPKEPFYFDTDMKRRIRPDTKTYLSLFSKADPTRHLAVGEASTDYMFSQIAVPGILELNPRAKFIALVRNPVDLVVSLHSEMLFACAEDLPDFEEAWRAQDERRSGRRIPPTCLDPKNLFYSDWGKLGAQMERLLRVVERQNLLVLLFRDLALDTRKTYEDVLAFLGVPDDGRSEFPRFNENKKVRSNRFQPTLLRTGALAARIKMRLGIRARTGLLRHLFSLNVRREPRPPLSARLKAELREFFREDTERLATLLGRDLSHWTAG